MKEVYKNVATSVIGDFSDIGSAIGELQTRLGLQGEELEYASEQMLKYAKVTGQDAVTATQDVASMMRNTGIPTEELAATLDKLTVAGEAAGIDVSNLAVNVTKYNAVLKEMGFTTDEQIALMAQFEQSGADTTSILNSMKKGVANWAKEGKNAGEEFKKFVEGVQDGSVTAGDAVALFGTKGGLSMYEAAQKGQLSYESMYDAIVNSSEGTLDRVYTDTMSNSEKISLAWQGVKVATSDIFTPLANGFTYVLSEVLLPGLSTVISGIAGGIQAIIGFFSNFSENMANIWAVVSGGAVTAWDAVKTAIMTPISAVSGWLSSMWTSITSVASAAWTAIKNAITSPIETAKGIISTIVSTIKGFFNFDFSWPSIPLPHFVISPQGWKVSDLFSGSIPSLSIQWYATGGIVDGPTLIGAGEAGPEAIVPLNTFWDKLETMGERTNNITININGADSDPKEIAEKVADEIQRQMNREELAYV